MNCFILLSLLFIIEQNVAMPSPSTMKSMWEMMHPSYEGVNGELLWHVYYGDLSEDERFEDFRRKELWDTHELKAMMDVDEDLHKYQNDNAVEGSDASDLADLETGTKTASNSHGFGGWIFVFCVLVVLVLVYCYKYGGKQANTGVGESKPLLVTNNFTIDCESNPDE
eukprot:6682_1